MDQDILQLNSKDDDLVVEDIRQQFTPLPTAKVEAKEANFLSYHKHLKQADNFFSSGDINKAEEYYNTALMILQKIPNTEIDSSTMLDHLGHMLVRQCKFEEAHEKFLEAYKLKLKFCDSNSHIIADSLEQIGNNCRSIALKSSNDKKEQMLKKAINYHNKALKIRESLFDLRNLNLYNSYLNRGNCYFDIKMYEEAKNDFKEAKAIIKYIVL